MRKLRKLKSVLSYDDKNDLSQRIFTITTHILITAAHRQVTDTVIRKEICVALDIGEAMLSTLEKLHKSNPRRLRLTPTNRTALNRYFSKQLNRAVDVAPELELHLEA